MPAAPSSMKMEIPSRIHIMPLGFEKSRAWESAEKLKADEVVLVIHRDDDPEANEYLLEVEQELEKLGIQVHVEQCDLFDLYDSLGTIAEQIEAYGDNEVFVNVATGSKVTAIAGMIACMTFDAVPYYVRARDYNRDGEPAVGASEIIELPKYNIEKPEKEQIQIMEYILRKEDNGETVTKGNLIHEAEQRSMPFITQSDAQEKGKYRLLDRAIIDPLTEAGYIRTEKSGRSKNVHLTEDGRQAVQAFASLI